MSTGLDAIISTIDHRPDMSSADLVDVVRRAVARHLPLAADAERAHTSTAILDRLDGRGPIDRLLTDPTVDEVLVHAGTQLWVERAGCLTPMGTITEGDVSRFLERSLAPAGRRLDRTSPTVDARLADGTRLCAAVAPIAVAGTEVALRRHRTQSLNVKDFCPPSIAALVSEILSRRLNILITGATSSGKTSFLTCLVAGCLSTGERLVLLEDTAEIVADGHLVRLETRPPNAEGTAPIHLDDLLITALRMRPDRLVVGEIRGNEVVTLIQAMNTGHDGSMATCHANGPADAIDRLAQLVLRASPGWPMSAILDQLRRSIDIVIHLGRGAGGQRRVLAIAEPDDGGTRPLADHRCVLASPNRTRQL